MVSNRFIFDKLKECQLNCEIKPSCYSDDPKALAIGAFSSMISKVVSVANSKDNADY